MDVPVVLCPSSCNLLHRMKHNYRDVAVVDGSRPCLYLKQGRLRRDSNTGRLHRQDHSMRVGAAAFRTFDSAMCPVEDIEIRSEPMQER